MPGGDMTRQMLALIGACMLSACAHTPPITSTKLADIPRPANRLFVVTRMDDELGQGTAAFRETIIGDLQRCGVAIAAFQAPMPPDGQARAPIVIPDKVSAQIREFRPDYVVEIDQTSWNYTSGIASQLGLQTHKEAASGATYLVEMTQPGDMKPVWAAQMRSYLYGIENIKFDNKAIGVGTSQTLLEKLVADGIVKSCTATRL